MATRIFAHQSPNISYKKPSSWQNKNIYNRRRKNYLPFSQKPVFFKHQETCTKKGGELLDVTMGAYDDAKICKLVELFMLYKYQQLNKIKNFVLHRDNGLALVKKMSGPKSEKVKKELQGTFKEFDYTKFIG